jgi:hypothetical protein
MKVKHFQTNLFVSNESQTHSTKIIDSNKSQTHSKKLFESNESLMNLNKANWIK